MTEQQPLWTPSQASIDVTSMTRFIAQANHHHNLSIKGNEALNLIGSVLTE